LKKGSAPLKSNKTPIPTTSCQVGRAYVINKKQAHGATTVVTGTLTLNSISLTVLFDSGATHSFISSHAAAQIRGKVDTCPIYLYVTLATGKLAKCEAMFKNCPITMNQEEFKGDLIQLDQSEFDIILGMN